MFQNFCIFVATVLDIRLQYIVMDIDNIHHSVKMYRNTPLVGTWVLKSRAQAHSSFNTHEPTRGVISVHFTSWWIL